jgi:hypothetical protein
MKVVNPDDTSHTIGVVPRYYGFTGAVLTLTSLAKDVDIVVSHTELMVSGVLTIGFDFDFIERDKYSIKLLEGTEVVYRGQLFATDQEPQDFDITVNYYSYE